MGASVTKTGEDFPVLNPAFSSLLPYYLRDVSDKKRVLGNGSYAVVKELEVKGKKCAAKQLHAVLFDNATPQQQDAMLQRFAAECNLLEGIKHPNIVRFFGVHIEKGSQLPYLVMELLDSTLSAHLENHGVPDPPTYYNILSDVALGLRYLHEQSSPIVHRDLSANNVLLSSSLKAKISDLGVAKVLNLSPSEMTHMTQAPGTPLYMPPEATVDSPQYTTTIDVFSFGVLMIHTLCGNWPLLTPAAKVDPQNPNQLIAVSEFDRRASDVHKIGLNHPLMPLIRECLHNNAASRPSMTTIVKTVVDVQISQPHTTCATNLVCSSYNAKESYELSLRVGDEVTVMRRLEGKRVKAKSLSSQDIGYVPSHLLLDRHQLPVFIALEDYSSVLEDYSSGLEDNLCFKKGDRVLIINTDEEDRWFALHENTGKKGYIERIQFREKLEGMRWYFGVMSHAVADDLLKQPPNDCGSYLVHDESEDVRCLALRGQKSITHYEVKSCDGLVCIGSVKLKTLKKLIKHFKHSPLESTPCSLLGQPCSNPFGPLQPHFLHDGEVKRTISTTSLCVVKEIQTSERKCAGKQFNASLFNLNTAKEIHGMLLRFADQCRLCMSAQHPNIVEFFGVYFEKGSQVPYIVTELLDFNLSTYLKKHGVPPPPMYHTILSDVATGLRYLHEQSPPIIHGDLSARNVLLCSNYQAKISNLGVIQILDHVPVQTLESDPETLCYMAPETCVEGSKQNTAIDCFSFGILMIHTLCAKCPIPQQYSARNPEPKSRLDQCDAYIKAIYCKHPLLNLIRACLDENPKNRPDISTVATSNVWQMKATQFPVFISKCNHDSCSSDELSFKKGDVMYIIGKEEGKWFAQLKETGKQGYISNPSVKVFNLDDEKGVFVQIPESDMDAEKHLQPCNKSGSFLLRQTNNLDAEKWFFGGITKMDAEKQLLQPCNKSGSFLVRHSESQPGTFALTVKGEQRLLHYRIRCNKDGKFFVTQQIQFHSIPELVNYYSKDAKGLCMPLLYPCQVVEKSRMKSLLRVDNMGWEIDGCDIKFIRNLKEELFKEVWEGTWKGVTRVAVIVLKPVGIMSQAEYLQEANLMKNLHHANVIQLYGVCTKEEMAYIITELMESNLLDYLRRYGRSMKLPDLVDKCREVSSGMAYLEQNNIIHRDLAARNILMTKDITCKVANFGMVINPSVYEELIKRDRISVKWMAPEAALNNRFSSKSDVWSFGIVMHEVLTYGRFPYPGMANSEVLEAVERGYRMPQPRGCPDMLYNIMQCCWKADPEERYTFETLNSSLTEFETDFQST